MRRAGCGKSVRCARRVKRARGFALPLVMLVGLVSAMIIVLLLERSTSLRLALKRQTNEYAMYHTQAGLTEFLRWWGTAFRLPTPNSYIQGSTLGFDMAADAGGSLQVRLFDEQGRVRRRTAQESVRDIATAEIFNRAALMIARDNPSTWNSLIRDRGPSRVHINSAPREVLVALAMAVSKDANGQAFADAVLEARQKEPINSVEKLIQATSTSELKSPERDRLDACFSLTCEYWRVEARAVSSSGEPVAGPNGQQGGYAVGSIAALDPQRTAASKDWQIVWWGPLEDLPGRVTIEQR